VQKLLRRAVYWSPFAMLLKQFWDKGSSNNMFSTLLMGGRGHTRKKDNQNVKSFALQSRAEILDCAEILVCRNSIACRSRNSCVRDSIACRNCRDKQFIGPLPPITSDSCLPPPFAMLLKQFEGRGHLLICFQHC
jgi:hypothetical protein